MGNSNEMCRKILNSPNHAEPCLVAAAKKVLLPTNWVFLHGKAHSDYRRALNVLFTKQALRYVPFYRNRNARVCVVRRQTRICA